MDFHSLPRRELQALCKKNHIPANMTNAAMADALQALHDVGGGMESIQDALQNQSPKKAQTTMTDLTRSSRRASARRAAAPPTSVEPKEQPASPLPRARRVTVKASEIQRLVSEGEEDKEEEEKEGLVEATPVTLVKRSTATTSNTRRRTSKKEGPDAAEEGLVEAAKTPATRNGRRTTTRRGTETPAVAERETEDTSRVITRRTRQSSKSINAVDATTTTVRRSTRARASASVREMETMAREEEEEVVVVEQVEKCVEIKNSSEKEDDPREYTSDLALEIVSDLGEPEGIQDKAIIGSEDCNVVVENANLPQHQLDVDAEEDGMVPEPEGFDDENALEIAENEEVEEGVKPMDSLDKDGDGTLSLSDEKPLDLAAVVNDVSHLCSMDLHKKADEEIDGDQDCNAVVENSNLLQHQETEGFNGEVAREVEGGCEGEQEANQADNMSCGVGGGSPVGGLISYIENLEIAGDAADEESKKEEEEKRLYLVPEGEIPDETKNSGCIPDQAPEAAARPDASAEVKEKDEEYGNGDEIVEEAIGCGMNISEVVASSPPQLISVQSSLQRSNPVDLPADEILYKVGDVIEGSPAKLSGGVRDASVLAKALPEVAESKNSIGALMTAGIIFQVEKSGDNSQQHRDADKENRGFAELTMTEAGCGEAKVKTGAERDLKDMSLRKLRMLYKEQLININNSEMEGRRLALAELNENNF